MSQSTAEQRYLKPEVIQQVSRLDLRARFIIEGFLAGLHASPFHGFSVQFSEHRRYTPGDPIADIDWNVYAKTDRFYVKKFEAETNLTGYLALDLSGSMGYTQSQELTKFDYAICLAAALAYLMIHQQDPVGMVAFDTQIRQSLAPKSQRSQLATMLALLSRLRPTGVTDVAQSLLQVASMLRHRSLVMIFSDLLGDPGPIQKALFRFRHAGHDVILFHILDEAEALFTFDNGLYEMTDPETGETLTVDAEQVRAEYLEEVTALRDGYRREAGKARIDYVPLHTGMRFDEALLRYLKSRTERG